MNLPNDAGKGQSSSGSLSSQPLSHLDAEEPKKGKPAVQEDSTVNSVNRNRPQSKR